MVVLRKYTRRNVRRSSVSHSSTPIIDSEPQENQNPSSSREPSHLESFDSIHSPYFLTSSDNPGLSLVQEVLDGTNYGTWNIAITIALDAKNKIGFIDGSIPRPAESDPLFRIWSRCNSMVKSWLLNSVSKQIYGSILRYVDASAIWKHLLTRFHITNLPRSYQLTQQIWSLQQGNMSLSDYYTTLKTLWDDLDSAECIKTCHDCVCCKAIDDKAEHGKVIKFLAGLNESYNSIRSQIIMKKTIPDLAGIYNLLDQDHNQRTIGPVLTSNASVFNVSAPPSTTTKVEINAAHYKNSKPPRPICSHCGYTGHTIEKCYKLHGYPPGFKHKSKQSEKPSVVNSSSQPSVAQVTTSDFVSAAPTNPATMFSTLSKDQIQDCIAYFSSQLKSSTNQNVASSSGGNITTLPGMAFSNSSLRFIGILRASNNSLSSQCWIVDSGATHHVCHDRKLFFRFSDELNSTATLPTGINVRVAGFGSIKLNKHMILHNVLYILDFHLNLLSISQLTKDLGSRVIFDEDTCLIQDRTRELTIGQADCISNLYILDAASLPTITDPFYSVHSSIVVDSVIWHKRLGHPSLYKTKSIESLLGLQTRSSGSFHCEVCPPAK